MSCNGVPTNGIFTFANSLLSYLKENNYFDVRVAFDKGKKTFRHQAYDAYKAGRSKTPDELIAQLPVVREFMNATGIGFLEMDDYEADDIVGSFATKAVAEGFDVEILSSDKDLWQIIGKNVSVISPISGLKDFAVVDRNYVFNKWSIEPDQVVDYKAINGDASDNIKGVPGIGEKGAVKLLAEFKTLDGIFENIESITGATKTKLINGKESAYFSKMLATIKTDIDFSDSTFEQYEIDMDGLKNFFSKYQMFSLMKKFCSEEKTEVEFNFESFDGFEKINFQNRNYIYVEILNDDYHAPNIIGVGLSNSEGNFYINTVNPEADIFNWDQKNISERFQRVLTDGVTQFETYDVKKTICALEDLGYKINYEQFVFDTKSAIYVLDPESGATPDRQLSIFSELESFKSDEDVFGKGAKRTANIPVDEKRKYIARKTFILSQATKLITEKLSEANQLDLYFKIDHPLNFVLHKMEQAGVTIDADELKIQTEKIQSMIIETEKDILNILGEGFSDLNIASPKQLKELLFEKLKLPNKKKGSTDKEVLEELINEHPVIEKILQHRKLSKLASTYLVGFNKYIRKKKIHTKFNQSLTATGRLSSSDPNLQNISIRDELQRQVRKVFVTSSSDYIFMGLDYSQIELRVLAQMANEHHMIEMFNNNLDIHEEAARKIFKLDSSAKVTSDMRRVAKVFNFGIAYGLSDFGLARDLKISVGEAKSLIASYFETFADLKKFIDQLISDATKIGYAKTLSNRRRNIPQLAESNFMIQSFGKRIAVNMPIQGTAADILKVAMINIDKKLLDNSLDARMVAQIHDELILEVKKTDLKATEEIVKSEMKSALKDLISILEIDDEVKVDLSVSYSEADNWLGLK
jgi:DNA polymerase-1